MTFGDERLPARFWEKAEEADGCWLWTGANDGSSGYGKFFLGGAGSRAANRKRRARAHRVAYEALVGPIGDGLQLDHLCRTPACVNPAHLEPVTQRENILRGRGPEVAGKRNAAKTHCVRGHEYAGDNLRIGADGYRYCRACKAVYEATQKARKAGIPEGDDGR